MDTAKIFHYTNGKAWKGMQYGYKDYLVPVPNSDEMINSEDVRGLYPTGRCIALGNSLIPYPDKAYESVNRALLEPIPDDWIHNDEFQNIWVRLMGDIMREKTVILLEVTVNFEDDDVWVLDRGHVEHFLYQNARYNRKEAFTLFWNSRVPLKFYLTHQNELGFRLPVVVIFSIIPVKRLRVIWEKTLDEMTAIRCVLSEKGKPWLFGMAKTELCDD
jgi:hypothetical protein